MYVYIYTNTYLYLGVRYSLYVRIIYKNKTIHIFKWAIWFFNRTITNRNKHSDQGTR